MRNRLVLITWFIASLALCQNTVVLDTAYHHNKHIEALAALDTSGLSDFWAVFKAAVREDRKADVVSQLEFPIRETLVDAWHFSIHCDTAHFALHHEEFLDADITADNVLDRYGFLFTAELKMMISRTDVHRILREGYSRAPTAITYLFWAKHYGYGCGSDTSLKFHFHRTPSGWRLSIASVG